METILIAGGKGSIGSSIAKHLKKYNFRIIGIGNNSSNQLDNEKEIYFDQWISGSVTLNLLEKIKEKVDFIINCTGSGTVGYSNKYPAYSFIKSIESTNALLEYSQKYQKDVINIFLSSAAVYGDKKLFIENNPNLIEPISRYGLHKVISENIYSKFSKMYNLKVIILRLFSIYGEGFRKQLLWDACNKFESCNSNQIEFWGTGEERRDWLNIKDFEILIEKLIKNKNYLFKKDLFDIFNCGSGNTASVKEVLNYISSNFQYKGQIVFNNIVREGDPFYQCASIKKIKEKGWDPSINIEKGIKDYCNWVKLELEINK